MAAGDDIRDAAKALSPAGVRQMRQVLLQRVVIVLERAVKREAPVRTGALRRSIVGDVVSPGQRGVVAVRVPYARSVHDGSQPHIIRPRNPGGVLSFEVNGQRLFRKYVRHPGNKANPFLDRALDQSMDEINDLLDDAALEMFSKVIKK